MIIAFNHDSAMFVCSALQAIVQVPLPAIERLKVQTAQLVSVWGQATESLWELGHKSPESPDTTSTGSETDANPGPTACFGSNQPKVLLCGSRLKLRPRF